MGRALYRWMAVIIAAALLAIVALSLAIGMPDAEGAPPSAIRAAPHAGYNTDFTYTCTPASNSGFQCAAGGTDSARQTNAALGSGYFRRIRTTSTYINLDFSTFANPIPAHRYVRVTRGGNSAAQSMASGTSNYSQYTGYETGFRWTGNATLGSIVQNNTGDVTIEILQYTAPSAPSRVYGDGGRPAGYAELDGVHRLDHHQVGVPIGLDGWMVLLDFDGVGLRSVHLYGEQPDR